MATLPKVLISRADYQIGGGVALGLSTQACMQSTHLKGDSEGAFALAELDRVIAAGESGAITTARTA
jgi:hypothetical protein